MGGVKMKTSREDAVNAIISSIAAEETALARMITAESKKIEYVLCCVKSGGCTEKGMRLLLDVNKSAENLMHRIADIQMLLKNKLALVMDCFPCPPPPHPHPPPHPPSPTYTCEEFMNMPFPMDEFNPLPIKEFMEREQNRTKAKQDFCENYMCSCKNINK